MEMRTGAASPPAPASPPSLSFSNHGGVFFFPGVSPEALLGKQWWRGPGGPRSLPGWGYDRLRLTPGYSSSIRALRPGPNRYQGRSVCVPGGCCARKPGPNPGVGPRARA
jgi:hypothetical protein